MLLFAQFVFTFCKLTHWSFLVVKSFLTRCKKLLLVVLFVTRYKKWLVTHCKKSLVTRWKIRLLFVAKVARCKKHCYFLQNPLNTLQKSLRASIVYSKTIMLDETFGFFQHNLFPKAKALKLLKVNVLGVTHLWRHIKSQKYSPHTQLFDLVWSHTPFPVLK